MGGKKSYIYWKSLFHQGEREKGQATIFMAIFITTMILLLAFTVNIGMLVHAKINLQNAADAAAYAGAAVQAKQMTAIAYLNWEMRRAVKEFLFNWMVRGNRSQACFPLTGNGLGYSGLCDPVQGHREHKYNFSFWDPRSPSSSEALDAYVPTTCIIFKHSNNYCQLQVLAGIPRLSGLTGVLNFVNPIIQVVTSTTGKIIDAKVEDCQSRGRLNKLFLFSWLFNLDKDPFVIQEKNDFEYAFGGIKDSEDALGVLPRQAMLRARIDNFEEALNLNLQSEALSPDATINESLISVLTNDKDKLFYYERPIQAYLSAYNNLPLASEHNGIFSDINLEELIPHQSNVARNNNLKNDPVLFKLNDITDNVITVASEFTVDKESGRCAQRRVQMRIPSFPIGVAKDPRVITYYAVSLRAKARLLFSPFRGGNPIPLTSYSAAKPFGSRIGKNLEANPSDYIHSYGKKSFGEFLTGEFKKNNQFLNILVSGYDKDSEINGFASNGHLGYLRQAIVELGIPGAFRLAGAYAPWEIGYYTIPANFQELSNFANNPNYGSSVSSQAFKLRAPISPVNGSTKDIAFLINRIEAMFTYAGFLNPGESQDELNTLKAGYMNAAKFALLENFLISTGRDRFHFIPDPILSQESDILAYAKKAAYGSDYTVAAMERDLALRHQLSSWNTKKSSSHHAGERIRELGPNLGRAGYSVRFIAFRNLKEGGLASNDDGNIYYSSPFSRISPGNESAKRILEAIDSLQH